MFDTIVNIYREITGDETTKISPKTKINGGLNLSSFGRAQLICEIEDQFDIEFSEEELRSFKTIQNIADCLENKVK